MASNSLLPTSSLATLAPLTTAATALSNLILVSPQATQGYQPQSTIIGYPNSGTSPANPPSFLFNYEGEQTVTLKSDITDHFVEDNSAIQDQIALKPEQITTHGFVGELNDIAPNAVLAALQAAANKLTIISSYTPVLSATALLAYNEAFQAYQIGQNAVTSAVAAWSSIGGTGGESVIGSTGITNKQPNQNKQQQMFQQFYGYWRTRTLFTVQTPWAVFQNMAIEELRAIQDETTSVITDFQLVFKMIRVASTTTAGSSAITTARLSAQSSGLTNLGTSTPAPSISLSQGLTNMGVTP